MRRFDDLPNEIILEILSRLPTESALECKLVCKPWRDFVHHPSYCQMHLNHINSAGSGGDSGKLSFVFLSRVFSSPDSNPITGEYNMRDEFCYAEYDENSQETPFSRKARINVNFPFYKSKYDYSFAGSCNGLICLDSWFSDIYGPTYIFNPITGEYIMLPTPKGDYWWTGFGYILSINEYKVVRIYNTKGNSNVRSVQVYTLGSGTGWRDVGTMERKMQNYRKSSGAFANGVFYWVDDQGTILAFNLVDEKFSTLPSPPWSTRPGLSTLSISLGVLTGFLSATYSRNAFFSEMWLLKKNKDNNDFCWIKEFTSDIRVLRNSPPFGYTKSGKLLCYDNNKIYVCHPKTSCAKIDVNFGKAITDVIPYKSTLVSLKVLGEKDAKTMESAERANLSEETRNINKLRKPQNEVTDI